MHLQSDAGIPRIVKSFVKLPASYHNKATQHDGDPEHHPTPQIALFDSFTNMLVIQ